MPPLLEGSVAQQPWGTPLKRTPLCRPSSAGLSAQRERWGLRCVCCWKLDEAATCTHTYTCMHACRCTNTHIYTIANTHVCKCMHAHTYMLVATFDWNSNGHKTATAFYLCVKKHTMHTFVTFREENPRKHRLLHRPHGTVVPQNSPFDCIFGHFGHLASRSKWMSTSVTSPDTGQPERLLLLAVPQGKLQCVLPAVSAQLPPQVPHAQQRPQGLGLRGMWGERDWVCLECEVIPQGLGLHGMWGESPRTGSVRLVPKDWVCEESPQGLGLCGMWGESQRTGSVRNVCPQGLGLCGMWGDSTMTGSEECVVSPQGLGLCGMWGESPRTGSVWNVRRVPKDWICVECEVIPQGLGLWGMWGESPRIGSVWNVRGVPKDWVCEECEVSPQGLGLWGMWGESQRAGCVRNVRWVPKDWVCEECEVSPKGVGLWGM